MKEKIAATKKASPMDSGNEASSEDSNDSNSSERKDFASGSKDDLSSVPPTNASITSLINMLRTNDAICVWTGSDQSMFRALHKVFLSNYCAIASSMLTKTCQEVSFARHRKLYK